MRAALTALASLLLLASCTAADDDTGAEDGDAAGPTWSVPCESATAPAEPIGDLELPCLGDEAPTQVGVQGDRPLVIVLWASWCAPCADEAPEVEAFHREFGDRIDVLGVDSADTRDKGRWFAEDFAMTYPSVFDPDEEVRIALGVPALPGVAFVDGDGTLAELVVEPGLTAESLAETAEAAFGLEPS